MHAHHGGPFRILALTIASFLLLGSAGCSSAGTQTQAGLGAADDVIKALSRAADDAARLTARNGDPLQLNGVSDRIKNLLHSAPENKALSPDERAVLKRAAQQAAIAREIAAALGLADEVKAAITTEAVELVKGARYAAANRLSPALQRHLEEAGISVLRDTTCRAFLAAMPKRAASPFASTAQATVPSYGAPTATASPTYGNVYSSLETRIREADSALSDVTHYVDLLGLTDKVLAKSAGYVGKIKNSMTAATWQNAGAFRAYLQLCIFSK